MVPHAVQRGVEQVVGLFLACGDGQGSPVVTNHAAPFYKFFPSHILTVEGGLSLGEEVQGVGRLCVSNVSHS